LLTIYFDATSNINSPPHPYFYFYTNEAKTIELHDSPILNINYRYIFERITTNTDHPFYISDKGYQATSINVNITCDGSYNAGITNKNQSFTLSFKSEFSVDDTLSYYCTRHHDMINTFTVVGHSSL
jgi:hypothetical protein